MKRFIFLVVLLSVTLGEARIAQAQETLGSADEQAVRRQERLHAELDRELSDMETARLAGECARFETLTRDFLQSLALLDGVLASEILEEFYVRHFRAMRRPCLAADAAPGPSVESVADDLAPTLGEVGPQDREYAIRQLKAIYTECVKGGVPKEAVPRYQERYDRFQAEIRAARDAFRRAAIGTEEPIREILFERMRVYEAGLEGMPEGFLCRPATTEDEDGTSIASAEDNRSTGGRDTPVATRPDPRAAASFDTLADGAEVIGGDLDWLLGVWRAPQGGAIGFRQEADGTASAYVAELNDRMRENGYASGQVFLRGCRDRTSNSLAVWVHSARCEESFRERWEGASMVVIPVGDETLDVGSYYGDPLVGLAPLARSGL